MKQCSELTEFSISMTDNQPVLIITLSGPFSFEYLNEIQALNSKISTLDQVKFVVFDLSKLSLVESKMTFSFARIQKEVRDRGFQLRICGTPTKLKEKLLDKGVLRENELFANLTDAVKSLLDRQIGERRITKRDRVAA